MKTSKVKFFSCNTNKNVLKQSKSIATHNLVIQKFLKKLKKKRVKIIIEKVKILKKKII